MFKSKKPTLLDNEEKKNNNYCNIDFKIFLSK